MSRRKPRNQHCPICGAWLELWLADRNICHKCKTEFVNEGDPVEAARTPPGEEPAQ